MRSSDRAGNGSGWPYHQSINVADPTFESLNASLQWNETAGPWGTIVDRTQLDNVKDVTVCGRPNPVTGEVVAAKITPLGPEDPDVFKQRVRQFCLGRLERYKVPAVIEIIEQDHHGARFKKARNEMVRC